MSCQQQCLVGYCLDCFLKPAFETEANDYSFASILMIEDSPMEKTASLIVDAPVNLDLDSYISNYQGWYPYMHSCS